MAENYIDMLKQEFLDRKVRRPQYSERAFARDLELSSGFISLLFNGKRSLSPRTSLRIVRNLNWGELQTKKFMDSVQAAQLLDSKKEQVPKAFIDDYELELDNFRLVSNVMHFAILEFIQSRKAISIGDIIEYFVLERIECEMMLNRLERLGMITLEGDSYKATPKNTKLAGTPSAAIRNYHRHTIEMSLDSIESQDFSQRELRALTFSIDPKKIKLAKGSIDRFIKEFNKKYGNKKNGEIYQLNLQLFSHRKAEGEK